MVPVDGDPRARYRVLIAKKKRPDQFFHFRHTDLNSEIGKCISRQQEVGDFALAASDLTIFRANADVEKTTKKIWQ